MAGEDRELLEPGRPGASARREAARRRAARERRVRERYPRLGGLLLALASEPAHERSWRRGAAGEQRVAELLERHLDPGVLLLHDRRIPGGRANIDHIAIAASGVWVIDAKRYKGKIAITGRPLGPSRLMIAGRDRSPLAEGLARQVGVVERVAAEVAPLTSVHGALCFVEAQLPLLRTLRFAGYPLLHPRPLAKHIGRPAADQAATALLRALQRHLPPA